MSPEGNIVCLSMNIFDSIKFFWNTHIRNRLRSGVVLIIVVILSAASLLFQYFRREDAFPVSSIAMSFVVPFQQGVNSIGGFLFDRETRRLEIEDAKEQIAALEKENERLKIDAERNKDLLRENEDLRALLRAKERLSSYDMIEASVIGSENADVFRRFTIDRGSLDGIETDMNVINQEGLIGYVSSVGLNYAVVTCIIEDGISVSAMTRNERKNLIVTGDLALQKNGMLKLENALSSIDFKQDSTLVTSAISEKFIPGLLIGYVTESTPDDGNLTVSGLVKCAVDFSDIREVLVITNKKQQKED